MFYRLKTVNPTGLPVVFAGDFNSHKNRSNDSVATAMHRNGYYDAYDLARSLYRQHYNSYNAFSVIPKISYTWGDHVDHVWAIPSTSWVDAWRNGVLIKDGRLVKPIPSDHSPVVVDLRVN
jgi:endonuclease/exonuclease/phosphatase (EEP) superfamily protein YafD